MLLTSERDTTELDRGLSLKVLKESLLLGSKMRLVRWWLILDMSVRVEMGSIERVLDSWNPRRRDLLQ